MRKMDKRIGFSISIMLSLALVVTSFALGSAKTIAGARCTEDPNEGTIQYFTAKMFDYEETEIDEDGNWIVNGKKYASDSDLLLFTNLNNRHRCTETASGDASYVEKYDINKLSLHNSLTAIDNNKVVQGLANNKVESDGKVALNNGKVAASGSSSVKLFDTGSSSYVGSFNFPFTNLGNNHYEFNSCKTHVNITNQVAENGMFSMVKQDDGVNSGLGYLPFNEINVANGKGSNGYYSLVGNPNYSFGTSFEIPFYYTSDRKVTSVDGSKEDMVFEFAGGDDFWVYIDGKLVLDLGGVHDVVSGKINFTTGDITIEGTQLDNSTGTYSSYPITKVINSSCLTSLATGKHVLQVYYLERSGSKPNLCINFCLPLEEEKQPEETIEPTVTDAPVPTCNPDTTHEPVATETPDETEGPSKDEPVVPDNTTEPANPDEETQNPEVTKDPSVDEEVQDPEVSEDPSKDEEKPEVTEEPSKDEENPKVTQDPSVNVDKEEDPAVSEDPVKDPEETKSPDVDDSLLSSKDDEESVTPNVKNPVVSENEDSDGDKKVDGSNDDATVIENDDTPLSRLPQTGTVAEIAFYAFGILLIASGIILGVYSKNTKKL